LKHRGKDEAEDLVGAILPISQSSIPFHLMIRAKVPFQFCNLGYSGDPGNLLLPLTILNLISLWRDTVLYFRYRNKLFCAGLYL